MRKKVVWPLLVSLAAFAIAMPPAATPYVAAASAPPQLQLYLDGTKLNSAVPPRIVQQTTLVPARVISEALGAEVAWQPAERSITITKENDTNRLTVGKQTAVANGRTVTLDLAPVLDRGHTMLPIRFIAENLGVLVRWDKPTRTVNLWSTTDRAISGSDPASDQEIAGLPESADPVMQQIAFINNQLMVKTSGGVTPNIAMLKDPNRLALELPGVRWDPALRAPLNGETMTLPVPPTADALVSRIEYTYDATTKSARIVADLKRPATYQVANTGDRNRLIVHLAPAQEEPISGNAVLIYHSHNRESLLSLLPGVRHPDAAFDAVRNIGYLGDRLAQRLKAGGAEVFHAADDYPAIYGGSFKYGQSYAYSEKTVRREMDRHPQIRYVFDLHRDASSRKSTTINIRGTDYARLYFVIGLENPDWRENDAFAKKLQSVIEAKYPGLSRGIYYKDYSVGNGWYNQNLSPRSALIEVGGVYNTLTESYRTVDILAEAIEALMKSGY